LPGPANGGAKPQFSPLRPATLVAVPRHALITPVFSAVFLAACACRSDPEPTPTDAVLARLDEIDARVGELEARLQSRRETEVPGVPEIATAPYDAKLPKKIRLHVSADAVRFGREPLDDDVLTRRLEAAVRRHGDPTVLLQADPDIDQARVEAVLDLVRRAGIRRLAIATTSESADTDAATALLPR
jgi:biopolymer transport protein ExbD